MIIENSKKWFIEVVEGKGKWEIWWTIEKTTGLERYSIHEKDTDNFIVFKKFKEAQKWLKNENKKEKTKAWQRELGMKANSISKWVDTPLNY